MNSLSRRKFLKISGATIATAAVVTGSAKTIFKSVDEVNKKSVKGVQKIPTYCDICFWKCAAIAYVKDGEALED